MKCTGALKMLYNISVYIKGCILILVIMYVVLYFYLFNCFLKSDIFINYCFKKYDLKSYKDMKKKIA